MPGRARVIAAIAAVLALSLAVRGASADSADPLAAAEASRQAAALALFQEGRRLLDAERYAEACPKFADSVRLDPAVGTMLNLAYCDEKLGKAASAWTAYLSAAAAARDKGEVERERVARARADVLEPTLARVTIAVPPQAIPGLEVRLDGTALPSTLWGVPIPVDAGPHALLAIAPGHPAHSSTVEATAQHTEVVTVPPLEAEQPTTPPSPLPATAPSRADAARSETAAVQAPAPTTTTPGPVAAVPEPDALSGRHPIVSGWHKPAAIVVGGAAIAALGIGAAFAIAAQGRYDDSKGLGLCSATDHCTPLGAHDRSVAFTYADVSTGAVVGGAAGVAIAAALWFTSPRAEPPAGRITIRPQVSERLWGIDVAGAF